MSVAREGDFRVIEVRVSPPPVFDFIPVVGTVLAVGMVFLSGRCAVYIGRSWPGTRCNPVRLGRHICGDIQTQRRARDVVSSATSARTLSPVVPKGNHGERRGPKLMAPKGTTIDIV